MKIYTKTGDDGSTGLIGGSRVPKSDLRLDCYGTADELNATLGLVLATAMPWMKELLLPVQNELFVIGSHLAAPAGATQPLPPIKQSSIARLETHIDAMQSQLPPLTAFILPGGTETAARLHLARTVCRRCERLVVAFTAATPVDAEVITYLNRLSDFLFVVARLANHSEGVADVPWEK